VDDQIIITVSRRIVLKFNRIWCEGPLQENGFKCVRLFDSISQEEFRRFVDMGLVDADGFMTKTFSLAKTFIRPRLF